MNKQIEDEGLTCAYLLGKSEGYQQGKADKEKELLERIEKLESRVSELESACSALINGYA